MSPGESHGSFLVEDLVQGVSRLCLKKKTEPKKVHPFSQNKTLASRQGKIKFPMSHKHFQRRSFTTSPKLLKEPGSWIQQAKQVFGRPTYDATVKKVLADDEARLDFIKTFAKLPDVVSTQPLDASLNPIRRMSNLKELLRDSKIVDYMEDVQQHPTQYKVMGYKKTSPLGTTFLRGVGAHYGDLLSLLPLEQRDSEVDVLCRLSTDEYVLVEVQVKKQNYWDKRALAYAAHVYGNQLRKGQPWKDLKKLICINVLGAGPESTRFWPKGAHFMRHYIMQDQKDPNNIIPELQLIQYSLGNVRGDEEELKENKDLKDWLDYYRNAQNLKEIPEGLSPGLHKAYELSKDTGLLEKERADYDEQDDDFSRYSHHIDSMKMEALEEGREEGIEKGKEEGKKEGIKEASLEIARNMIKDHVKIESIISYTGLTEEEIKNLQE